MLWAPLLSRLIPVDGVYRCTLSPSATACVPQPASSPTRRRLEIATNYWWGEADQYFTMAPLHSHEFVSAMRQMCRYHTREIDVKPDKTKCHAADMSTKTTQEIVSLSIGRKQTDRDDRVDRGVCRVYIYRGVHGCWIDR